MYWLSEASRAPFAFEMLAFGLQQLEEVEADLEAYQGTQTKKGRNKADKEKMGHLEEMAQRHRRHLERLEQMLKLLTTESLEVSLPHPFHLCAHSCSQLSHWLRSHLHSSSSLSAPSPLPLSSSCCHSGSVLCIRVF